MPWSEIIGQERIIQTLRRSIQSGRIAHAYLFFGPDGVGKRAVALEFARALQCEQGRDEACGKCLACTKVARLIHPDVQFHFPYPKDTPADQIAERIQAFAANHYAQIDYQRRPDLGDPSKKSNKQAIYSIDRINQDLRRSMAFAPSEGKYKVAILTDAENMRVEAANAFLKMLEEPGPQSVFILTTSRPERVLPTIYSRCQRLRFDLLGYPAIEDALVERLGLDHARAATVARMADGSFTGALEHAGNDQLSEQRELVVDFFRQSYLLKALAIAGLVDRINAYGREQVKGILELMLAFVRDLILLRELGEKAQIANVDQREVIEKFVARVPDADLEGISERIEQAIVMVSRNVHIGLVFTVLAHVLHRGMREGRAPQLVSPLTET